MKNNKEKWLGTAGVLTVFIIVLSSLSTYASVLDQELSNQIWNNLDNVAAQSVYNIQEECRDQMRLMEDVSMHLSSHNLTDRDEIQPVLEECAEWDVFKRIGLALPNGETYTTDGTDRNVQDREYFVKGMQGKTGISNRLADYVDQSATIVFSAPVYDRSKEIIRGVVFATYDMQQFRQMLKSSVLQEEFGFVIMNRAGDIMVSDILASDGGIKNIYRYLEEQGKPDVSEAMLKMQEAVRRDGSYALEDKDYFVHISQLSINEWYFVAVAPTGVITSTRNSIMVATYCLCAVIIVLSLCLVLHMIYRERKKNNELRKIFFEDPLTGGYSYQRFRIEAMEVLAHSHRKAAFIVMDIDQFKLINELFGVKSGDDTLRHLDKLWREWIQPPEVYARRTGDCFSAVAFYDQLEELLARIDTFVKRVLDTDSNVKGSYVLRPHLGIYLIQSKAEDFESMQNNAAIVHGMMKGNNSLYYGIFDQEFKERTVKNKMLEDQLERAYRNKEYTVYYQPKYQAQTGKLCGAEALVRWRREDGELIPPGAFIPLAEKKGMVEKLDRYVFEEVCQQLCKWKEEQKDVVPVSVNLSRENLKNQNLVEEYTEIRSRYELDTADIEIELTESVLFENIEKARPFLEQLRSQGFKILMDDFGTGYSSLMMLKNIPVDVVKLDKSFVDDYNDHRGEQIIRCVVGMMNSLQMRVTAEGVETREQYEFLRDLGCDTIQGYYFARPMPAEEFAELL